MLIKIVVSFIVLFPAIFIPGFAIAVDLSDSLEGLLRVATVESNRAHRVPLRQTYSTIDEQNEDDDSESSDDNELLQVNGSIVLQYNSSQVISGRFGSDPYALLELALTPHDKFELYAVLFQSREFDVDEAYATWYVFRDDLLDLSFGRQYLPFGSYESAMISVPLTQVIGSIRGKEVFLASTQLNYFASSIYAFEGTSSNQGSSKEGHGYGLSFGYDNDDDYTIGIDYISDLAESDRFSLEVLDKTIPGIALYSSVELGRFSIVAEYITASRQLKPGDLNDEITTPARPSSIHLEVNFDLQKDRTLAIAWNKTRGTQELEQDTIRRYIGVTYSQPLYKGLSGAIEVAQFTDADDENNGTVNAQIVYDF